MDRKAVYMRNDVLFINAIIVITLLYSLIQGGQLIFMGGRVEKADAEIHGPSLRPGRAKTYHHTQTTPQTD